VEGERPRRQTQKKDDENKQIGALNQRGAGTRYSVSPVEWTQSGAVAHWRRSRRAERGTRPSIVTGASGRVSGTGRPFHRSDGLESGRHECGVFRGAKLRAPGSAAGAKAAALRRRGEMSRMSQAAGLTICPCPWACVGRTIPAYRFGACQLVSVSSCS
jgi:hypothetical protein